MNTQSHGGAYGGYRSTLLRFPDRALSVITLCNTAAASPTLAEEVGSVLLGLTAQPASASALDLSTGPWLAGAEQPLPDSMVARRRQDQLARVAGRYYSDELELPVTLAARDGGLVLHRPTGADIRFVVVSDELFTNSEQMILRVVRDDKGAITGFALTINRVRDLEFTRRN